MSKRFAVCFRKPLNILVGQRVIGYAAAKGLKWWRGMGTTWLFVDDSGELTASQLRDDLWKISSRIGDCLVIEISGRDDTWAALGDDAKNKFKWLRETWSTAKPAPLFPGLPGKPG